MGDLSFLVSVNGSCLEAESTAESTNNDHSGKIVLTLPSNTQSQHIESSVDFDEALPYGMDIDLYVVDKRTGRSSFLWGFRFGENSFGFGEWGGEENKLTWSESEGAPVDHCPFFSNNNVDKQGDVTTELQFAQEFLYNSAMRTITPSTIAIRVWTVHDKHSIYRYEDVEAIIKILKGIAVIGRSSY